MAGRTWNHWGLIGRSLSWKLAWKEILILLDLI